MTIMSLAATIKTKKVFIAYSWDGEKHQSWVLKLASDLIKNGIDVILDQFDLQAGHEMTHFMEKGLTSDKILIILTPNYKVKAEKRSGGVGYEYSLFTKELYDSAPDQTRIIPLLREGDDATSIPSYLRTRKYHSMTDDKLYDAQLFQLIKIVIDKPLIDKPTLGKLPSFKSDSLPDISKQLSELKEKEVLVRDKKSIIGSQEGMKMFMKIVTLVIAQLSKSTKLYKDQFNIHFHVKEERPLSITISTGKFTIIFSADPVYSNSASDANVKVWSFKGMVGFPEYTMFENKTAQLYSHKYMFGLNDYLQPIFIREGSKAITLSPEEIATTLFRDLMTNEIKRLNEKLDKE